MLICDDCLEKGYTNHPSMVRSRGKCDDSGQTKTGSPRVDQYGRRLR